MEVVVRAEEGITPPADTFVSLRIGQVQSHARFAPLRTYRFDSVDASGKANAKLEVFRRVGHTTVTFGGSTGDIQDVEVPMDDGKPLRMRLATSNARGVTPAAGEKRKSRQVNNARGYLAQHNIEDLLKDALKEVMSAKPSKPHEFLAAFILGRAGNTEAKLPQISPPQQRPASREDAKALQESSPWWSNKIKSDEQKCTTGKVAPRTLPPLESKPLGSSQSMPILRPWSPSEQPAPQQPKEQKAVPQPEPSPVQEPVVQPVAQPAVAFKLTPSVGTWLTKKPPAQPDRRPFQLRPSVGTWCQTIFVEPEPEEVPEYRCFALRPSVATWCAALPAEVPTEPTNYRSFQHKPSVGTWCAPNPVQMLSLDELTHWEPSQQEINAMMVLRNGRESEIKDLSQKLAEVSGNLRAAKSTGSSEAVELEATVEALQLCVSCAKNELAALENWSTRRGFSQPTKP